MRCVLCAGQCNGERLARNDPFVQANHELLAGPVLDRDHRGHDGVGAHGEQRGDQADDFISRVNCRQP